MKEKKLPDFLVLGGQKCGSSWMREMVSRHPDIYMPGGEVHYFSDESNYSKGIEWYVRKFSASSPGQIVGEKTPNYLWTNPRDKGTDRNKIPSSIKEVLPNSKFVVILRDPVDRAISAYNHHLSAGRVPPFVSIGEVLFGRNSEISDRFGILTMGMYDVHLRDYFDYFDRSQFLVKIFEKSVKKRPRKTLSEVFSFLGVDPSFRPQEIHQTRNKGGVNFVEAMTRYYFSDPGFSDSPLTHGTIRLLSRLSDRRKYFPTSSERRRIEDFYRPHKENCYEILGRRIEAWEKE